MFGHRSAFAGVGAVGDGLQVTVEVREPVGLDDGLGYIDAEAVDIAVEPESEHVEEHGAHLRVPPVQIGLFAIEHVEVPLPVR